MTNKRTILIFFWGMFLTLMGKAQDINGIGRLGDFFAGAPLEKRFDSCKKYFAEHELLGIDSVNSRGIYSSFKPGLTDHFPFPDSVLVKVLLAPDKGKALLVTLKTDNSKGIIIEAVLGNSKNAKQASISIYKQLQDILDRFYNLRESNESESYYSQGINKDFPDCVLVKGFTERQKFYYVLIECWGL